MPTSQTWSYTKSYLRILCHDICILYYSYGSYKAFRHVIILLILYKTLSGTVASIFDYM
ncbi:hypothetical protein F383_23824 [Gossypium arboreum]|uniref:Uncharacterized protein n=1 Tax=Gossypium arboreum TaxID=29729 RepID=A0A0B0NZ32_GOSAR|nr:hypothetical protein F383_23824 [Gossypium arboreum]